MTGLLTRLAALMTMGLSVLLMAMFGWQGATCIDQWTMAAGNLAMGASLVLGGSGAYSLDNMLLERKPALVDRPWFRWMSGSLPLPLTDDGYRKLAFVLLTFVVIFNVGSYNYYRGSVLTPFHSGPVSPTKHHLMAAHPVLLPDGSGRFHVYAAARLTLPVPVSDATTSARYVQLTDVDGRTFSAPLSGKT